MIGADKRLVNILIISLIMSLLPYNGEGWSDVEEISIDVSSERQYFPDITADSGTAHTVWVEDVAEMGWDVIYQCNDGTGWKDKQIVTEPTRNDWQCAVAAANGIVHVVWEYYDTGIDQDIYYTSYNGNFWSTPIELSIDEVGEDQKYPEIAAYGDKVYVAWMEWCETDWDIKFRRFNGFNWLNEEEISVDSGTEDQNYPKIAADKGKAYAIWSEGNDVYLRYFDGTNWKAWDEFTPEPGYSLKSDPSIAMEDKNLYVVWRDSTDDDGDIYYRHYDGYVWYTPVEISTDMGTENQNLPDISAKNNRKHVVWEDEYDGDKDIYYRYNDGTKWYDEEEISSDVTKESQQQPKVAAENYRVHIVWQDNGGGDADICYRNKDVHPPPQVTAVYVQGSQDIGHITDHTPEITWTYSDASSLLQEQYNVSVWFGEIHPRKLMGYINNTGDTTSWIYSGSDLNDGINYYVTVQMFNGFVWSPWYEVEIVMNTEAPLAFSPNYHNTFVDRGNNDSTRLSWQIGPDPEDDNVTMIVYGDLNMNPPKTVHLNNVSSVIGENYVVVDNIYNDGIYYWRVDTHDGYEWTIGDVWSFDVNRNDDPKLKNASVTPSVGNISTIFTFSVDYYDEDGNLPDYINLVIDDVPFEMSETDSGDTDVLDGKQYHYESTVKNEDSYFYFICFDGINGTYRTIDYTCPRLISANSGIISGTVKDAETGTGIYANVTIISPLLVETLIGTNSDGTYSSSDLQAGPYEIFATCPGYFDSSKVIADLQSDRVITIDFDMIKFGEDDSDRPVSGASISVEKMKVEIGGALTFKGDAVNLDSDVLTYSWHFEDDQESLYGKTVTHIFNTKGKFTVRLIVTDTDGTSDTVSVTITVTDKKKSEGGINLLMIIIPVIIIIIVVIILFFFFRRKRKASVSEKKPTATQPTPYTQPPQPYYPQPPQYKF